MSTTPRTDDFYWKERGINPKTRSAAEWAEFARTLEEEINDLTVKCDGLQHMIGHMTRGTHESAPPPPPASYSGLCRSALPWPLRGQERRPGWIGVDLDGTLAEYHGWKGPEHIGPPIVHPSGILMTDVVRELVQLGYEVRIFTARACIESQIPPVQRWLKKHGLGDLQVTCTKDIGMIELWDDRCRQFIPNTGIAVENSVEGLPDLIYSLRYHPDVGDTYSKDYLEEMQKG